MKKILVPLLTVAAVAAIFFAGCMPGAPVTPPVAPPEELPLGEPIRVAVIQPLTGEASLWGLPLSRGAQIWADETNAKGGILAGGEYHMVELKAYDNIAYLPAEELKMAKKAVLLDGAKYIFGTHSRGCREATAPFTTEQKVLTIGYGAAYLRPEYPYTMAVVCGSPLSLLVAVDYIVEEDPEVKRVAIICTDTQTDFQAWFGAAAAARNLDIVYTAIYPYDTLDFHSLLTAVLATEPDLICEMATAKCATLISTAKELGYTGYFLSDNWNALQILEKVPAEYLEGKLCAAAWADHADPAVLHSIYDTYIERYGEKEWQPCAGMIYDDLSVVLGIGVPAADSIDPTDVMNALLAMPEIDHPLYGKGRWGGIEIWGINNHLFTPVAMNVFEGGRYHTVAFPSFANYWDKYKDSVLPILDEYGLLYHP